MKQYLDFLRFILENGKQKIDRTKVGTISIFGYQMRFNLSNSFPLITTKKIHLKSVIYELLWFLKGSTNIKYLEEKGISIWNEWADKDGELGPVYGRQWRSWEGKDFIKIDQIKNLIENIKKNPNSRRHIVSAWNVSEIENMALPPCHCFFQFYVEENKISCQLYQRSADAFLGIPFNIASYSLLLSMVAQVCDLVPFEFIHTIGDAHIYNNHIDQVKLQLSRIPFDLPILILNKEKKNIDDFLYEDFQIENYKFHPSIKGEIAI